MVREKRIHPDILVCEINLNTVHSRNDIYDIIKWKCPKDSVWTISCILLKVRTHLI